MGHHQMTHRKVRHGYWDEELDARIDAEPFRSAEDEFFAGLEEPTVLAAHHEMYEAMNHLTKRQALVLRLHYGLDCEPFTTREIAEFLSWHQSTVQEHLEAGRRRLNFLLVPRHSGALRDSVRDD